jgi:hypothetical protein
VKVEVAPGTDQVAIKVIWPPDCALEGVAIERTGSISMKLPMTPEQLDTLSDGRRELHYPVPQPVKGDQIFVIWDWRPDAKSESGAATAE